MVSFLKYAKLYYLFSGTIIALGLISLVIFGYRFGIDFTGGTVIDVITTASKENIDEVFSRSGVHDVELVTTAQGITLKSKPLAPEQIASIEGLIQQHDTKARILSADTVGPTLGAEMVRKTLFASLLAIGGILLYMMYAFPKREYALAAIAALIHDFLVVLGIYSILSHFFGAEVNTLFVTALLTTMSFSVHDTIIIFDKVRELARTMRKESIETITDMALNQTLVRSYNNSVTSIIMLLALIVIGNLSIKFFLMALAIGIITGTYSSPFIATPTLVWLLNRGKKA